MKITEIVIYAKIIPESNPKEICKNLLLLSEIISEVPNKLNMSKIQGDTPIKTPDINTIIKFNSTIL